MVKRKGFTFVEVSLFMAVTAMLFVGVIVGMRNSMVQQRFNDITQNFYEFVRSLYNKVANPQIQNSDGDGTNVAVGKLAVFGQSYDLQGNWLDASKRNTVYVYDVGASLSGSERESYNNSAADDIKRLKPLLMQYKKGADGRRRKGNNLGVELFGVEEYRPRWDATIQNTWGGRYVGSILIFRHPESGLINTFVMDGMALEVNNDFVNASNQGGSYTISYQNLIYNNRDYFRISDINFCVSAYDLGESGPLRKQDIKIKANARNASSVIMVETESSENVCSQ